MRLALNPFSRLFRRPKRADDSADLYGAIVARTRLPAFYRDLGVPDTVEGRYLVLTLHLFAVLNRLKEIGPAGLDMAQNLMDGFTSDMDAVLREQGVSDLKVPKMMRRLAAASLGQMQAYETALRSGRNALFAEVAAALPMAEDEARLVADRLVRYCEVLVDALAAVPLQELRDGRIPQLKPEASLG